VLIPNSHSKKFTYYTDLLKSFIRLLKVQLKTLDKSCLESERELIATIKNVAKLYANTIQKTLFIFDEYDFVFTQLQRMGFLSKVFVLKHLNGIDDKEQADQDFDLLSVSISNDTNTTIQYSLIFEMFLSILLEY
jgi:hypothetical protein